MTEKKHIVSRKFSLTALVSLLFAWINTALNMGGIDYFFNVVKNPYYSSLMIGTSVKWLATAFVITIVINFFVNLFRKEKHPFSYIMVWLILLILIVGTIADVMSRLGLEEPAARYNFIQGCIANGKASSSYRSTKDSEKNKALMTITGYCNDAAVGYFKTYDACMKIKQNKLDCNKEAIFTECMTLKHDKDFCQLYTETNSIK